MIVIKLLMLGCSAAAFVITGAWMMLSPAVKLKIADAEAGYTSKFGAIKGCDIGAVAQTATDGRFRVSGSEIFAPDGSRFVAKGVNVNGYQWVWRRSTVKDADLISECWRFNLIRVNSFLFKGQVQWPQFDDNNDLDAIVDTFTKRHIVVLLEAHDRIGSYYKGADLNALVAWYTSLARRYRNNSYVWFDVMNEPGTDGAPDAANWIDLHRRVISAVRDDAEADNIIVAEGTAWAQEAGTFGKGDVPTQDSAILQFGSKLTHVSCRSYANIVFSIHVYEGWNFGDQKLANYLDRVSAKNFPLIVGEYGVDNGDERSTRAATTSLFDVAVPRQVGRVVWHWNGDPPNTLTDKTTHGGGWEINSCTAPTNLSWLGQRVWRDNHIVAGPTP